MAKSNESYIEMSKRVDGVEGMMSTLNDRLYESDKTQGSVVISLEKITDQLSVVFNKLKNNEEKFKEIEELTSPIKLVKSHWKLIIWIFLTSSSVGFAFDGGIKNIAHFFEKYKIESVTQSVMRNERNGE